MNKDCEECFNFITDFPCNPDCVNNREETVVMPCPCTGSRGICECKCAKEKDRQIVVLEGQLTTAEELIIALRDTNARLWRYKLVKYEKKDGTIQAV